MDTAVKRALLCLQNKINQVMIDEAKELAKKYGQDRRTAFADPEVSEVAEPEELIQDERCLIIMSVAGHIKRVKDTAFMRQARPGGIFSPSGKELSAVFSHVTCTRVTELAMLRSTTPALLQGPLVSPAAASSELRTLDPLLLVQAAHQELCDARYSVLWNDHLSSFCMACTFVRLPHLGRTISQ